MTLAYPTIILTAMLAAAAVSRIAPVPLPLTRGQRFGIALGGFLGAMFGAKLPFVLSDWDRFLSGAGWFSDGKTILCGLVGGYLGVEAAKWAIDVRVKTGDSFAVPVPIAVSIGRLGCFHAGCCYGTPTSLPWGVVFPHVDAAPRHPTQLYESIFHLLAAIGLAVLLKKGWLRGQLIKLYIIAYVAYRFATEAIRPETRLYGNLTGYQWSCLPIAALFLWLWARDAKRLKTQFVPLCHTSNDGPAR